MTLIAAAYELRLYFAGRGEAAGPIFVLKNLGWSDRQEIAVSGGISVTRLDVRKLPDEALDRISRGEDPNVVLASLSEPVIRALLAAGQGDGVDGGVVVPVENA
jgi:hypothetical protein